jgi:hypothetical protein
MMMPMRDTLPLQAKDRILPPVFSRDLWVVGGLVSAGLAAWLAIALALQASDPTALLALLAG